MQSIPPFPSFVILEIVLFSFVLASSGKVCIFVTIPSWASSVNVLPNILVFHNVSAPSEQDAINNHPGKILSFSRSEKKFRRVNKLDKFVFGNSGANYHIMEQFCNDRSITDFQNSVILNGQPEKTYKDYLALGYKYVPMKLRSSATECVNNNVSKISKNVSKVINDAPPILAKIQKNKTDIDYTIEGIKIYGREIKQDVDKKVNNIKNDANLVVQGASIYYAEAKSKVKTLANYALSRISRWSWW